MPFNLTTFKQELKQAFDQITKDQSEALSVQISANFIAGQTAAEKHKSIKSADPSDDEGLTDEEKAEIATLTALYLGYISEFNDRAQAQILTRIQELTEDGRDQDEIKQYLDDIFSGQETIIIDNTGQERKEIYVDENLKLSEVTRTVEKPFYTSVLVYASMIGENAAHTAYETGKKTYYKDQGYNQWVFVGPADERARPWHVALLGEVFTWGTERSNYAEQCLHEYHCRHRSNTYYGDERDVPAETWQKLKDDAGLHWDENKQQWALKYNVNTPKTKQKVTPEDVEKTIQDNEKTIKDRTTEKGLLFNKNGKLLIEKEGTEDKIHFTETEKKRFRGKIFTHNHPGASSSFSLADAHVACEYGLNEVRATTKDGTFILKMADGSNFNKKIYDEKIRDIFEKHRKFQAVLHINRMRNEVAKGKVTEDESLAWASKVIWNNTAKEIPELKYEFVRWD